MLFLEDGASKDSQWITAGLQGHPFLRLRETFSSYNFVRCASDIWGWGRQNRVCREAKYPRYGSVDISTTNAPIEDRTKGRDSLRCNLPLANGIKNFFRFKF
jgi:hypothetical protein